jgi:hypothetical protein
MNQRGCLDDAIVVEARVGTKAAWADFDAASVQPQSTAIDGMVFA